MLRLLQAPLLTTPPEVLPDGCQMRLSNPDDIEELGRLYYVAYDAEVACADEAEAIADIAASFAGAYGELWIEASPIGVFKGAIVAAVQTVRAAPWSDVPHGPFITEVFTDRAHRRLGLARAALTCTISTLHQFGARSVSLRVRNSNTPAQELYTSLGFREVGDHRDRAGRQ